jgi:hypothetical protein
MELTALIPIAIMIWWLRKIYRKGFENVRIERINNKADKILIRKKYVKN